MRFEMADVKGEKQEARSVNLCGEKAMKSPFEVGTVDEPFYFRNKLYSFILFLLLVPFISSAQNLPDKPVGHVNDFAHLLSGSERQQLETKLRNYRDTTTTVLAIATINSLDGHSIQQVGTQLFNKWNLWQGDKDNGVLILVAQKEHRIRIDVGYGLEGAIPDIMAGRIIRNVLNPAFKKGHYYAGLNKATSILIDLARGEYTGTLTKQDSNKSSDWASLIVMLLFFAFVIYASSRKGGGKNGGHGHRTLGPGGFIFLGGGLGGGGFSSGGGGFGGFSGGGGFGAGGGGASGGW